MFRKLFFQVTEKALQVSKKSQKSLLVNQMVCEEFALYFILINQILNKMIINQLMLTPLLLTFTSFNAS